MEQRKAWPSGRLTDLALVAQEICYRIAGGQRSLARVGHQWVASDP